MIYGRLFYRWGTIRVSLLHHIRPHTLCYVLCGESEQGLDMSDYSHEARGSEHSWSSLVCGLFFNMKTRVRNHHGVLDDLKDMEAKTILMNERSESDKIVDAMDFGELCNDFVCISSPSVEATARQLARDILELREGNCSLQYYSISVKYKDPIRTFMGRGKYDRTLMGK